MTVASFLGKGSEMYSKLSDSQTRDLLARGRIARLGCIVDGGPYITPINYFMEGEAVYSHSLPGLKIDALRDNPTACVQVDEIESDVKWRSVIAFGRYEEIINHNERRAIINRLLEHFPMLTPVESALAADGGPPPVIVFRIKLERVTGVAEE